MLIKLRMTLNEKLAKLSAMCVTEKSKSLNNDSKLNENNKIKKNNSTQKELEMREAMNNAIRMVVFNSILNLVFKLPLSFVPLSNAIATFYYQRNPIQFGFSTSNLEYHTFYNKLLQANLIYTIPDFGEWLLAILISIQLFVYSKFDRKIKTGLDRFRLFIKDYIKKKISTS